MLNSASAWPVISLKLEKNLTLIIFILYRQSHHHVIAVMRTTMYVYFRMAQFYKHSLKLHLFNMQLIRRSDFNNGCYRTSKYLPHLITASIRESGDKADSFAQICYALFFTGIQVCHE